MKNLIILNLKKIQNRVAYEAFRFRIDSNDLMSVINERLANLCERTDISFQHESQFWGYINSMIRNSAINFYRGKKDISELDCIENHVIFSGSQKDIDLKLLTKKIITAIEFDLNSVDYRNVFIDLVAGLSYNEIAEINDIPIGTVKGIIHRIRKIANEKYRNIYEELIY